MWSTFVDLMGLVGNIGFGAACLPMARHTYQQGSTTTPVSSIWLFNIAIWTFYFYLTAHYGFNPLTSVIGLVEGACWGVVFWYHYFPRKALGD